MDQIQQTVITELYDKREEAEFFSSYLPFIKSDNEKFSPRELKCMAYALQTTLLHFKIDQYLPSIDIIEVLLIHALITPDQTQSKGNTN